MSIQNQAERDAAMAAFDDARADLEARRAAGTLPGWGRVVADTIRNVDSDLLNIEGTRRQLAAMRFISAVFR